MRSSGSSRPSGRIGRAQNRGAARVRGSDDWLRLGSSHVLLRSPETLPPQPSCFGSGCLIDELTLAVGRVVAVSLAITRQGVTSLMVLRVHHCRVSWS